MSTHSERAFWLAAPGRGEIREEILAPANSGDVRVRTRYSGISRGSESLVFKGQVPPSQYALMRAPHQSGEFPGPLKYGYMNVGVVEQGPSDLLGRSVFCLYPHQTAYVVPASAVVPLPDGVPESRAVLAANVETAVNTLWDAGPRVGDRIAVIGAGVTGTAVALLASQLPGTRVELIDIDPRRAALAARLGLHFRLPGEASAEADLVFHASASEAGLELALRLAGLEAEIIEMSWFGDRRIALPLGEAFHSRRLSIRASQVGQVAPARRARWPHRRRLALALDLLRDDRFDALIDGECRFDELPQTLAQLADQPDGALCRRVRYD